MTIIIAPYVDLYMYRGKNTILKHLFSEPLDNCNWARGFRVYMYES